MSEFDAFRAANAGDIVIPAASLDHDKYDALKQALGGIGLDFMTIAGTPDGQETDGLSPKTWIDDEVSNWRDQYGATVDASYLESVVPINSEGSQDSRQMLTMESIKRAFEDMYKPGASTSISASKFYRRMVNSITELRDRRPYLQDGSVFTGERFRPSYIHPDQCWAITPEALHGLVLEPHEPGLRSSNTGMGPTTKARGAHLLAFISDAPQEVSVSSSGWLGHERGQSVG